MTQVPDSDEIRKERDEARRERDIAEAVMNRVIRERDKAREQLRLTLISDTMNEGEANDLRDALDAACAVLKLPDSTNDGGPADLAAELRTLLHNHRVEVEDVERERDELAHAKGLLQRTVEMMTGELQRALAERDEARALLREVWEAYGRPPDRRIQAALEGRDDA